MVHFNRIAALLLDRSLVVRSVCLALLLANPCRIIWGDELILQNGLQLSGTVVGVYGLNQPYAPQDATFLKEIAEAGIEFRRNPPFRMLDDGVRRYFVRLQQVAELLLEDELARTVSFKLQNERQARTSAPTTIGAFVSQQPFDEFGHRTVTLKTRQGLTPIIQGISELRPDYCQVDSLTHLWELPLDTKVLPAQILSALIAQATNRSSLSDRKATVLFYVQAELYTQAEHELTQLAADFPDLAEWCAEYQRQILESKAVQAINEIQMRKNSGQHQLAYLIATKFPENQVSAEVARQAEEIVDEYATALEDRDQALMMLDLLQAEIPLEQADRLKPLRSKLRDELHFSTLERLRPFLRAENDTTLTAQQKLALAYSGWILGSADATLDLEEAIRLWHARYLVTEFLRCDRDPRRETDILSELDELEGISVRRVAQMIPLMPLPYEPLPVTPGEVAEIEVPPETTEASAVRYSLQLPPEYSPHHRYPVIVALKGEGRTFESTVNWWGGDLSRPGWAQRRGYIVIAPHYCAESATDHDYTAESHRIVMESISHLRKRYRVDSDRIFITGHGMGGDACYDIALSQPGVFAGAIPFTAIIDKYSTFYWENAPQLAWYVVAGERDRETLAQNAGTLNRMMRAGGDIVYCEYKARGYESFFEEQERIFDWMASHQRPRLSDLKEFEVGSLRIEDRAFHWVAAEGLPAKLFPQINWSRAGRKQPRKFEAKITPGGTIYVEHPGRTTTIWLAPELFDFDNRCKIHVNRNEIFNDFVRPSIADMLTDLRNRGDEQRLYWARLEL